MPQDLYACITQVDYELGRLFGALRENDLFRNTWITFTSDHRGNAGKSPHVPEKPVL
ncbi:MAG: sulfatase-like hydrolase/transferase [Bacilli bacterium]